MISGYVAIRQFTRAPASRWSGIVCICGCIVCCVGAIYGCIILRGNPPVMGGAVSRTSITSFRALLDLWPTF